jgi:hypothetical protein
VDLKRDSERRMSPRSFEGDDHYSCMPSHKSVLSLSPSFLLHNTIFSFDSKRRTRKGMGWCYPPTKKKTGVPYVPVHSSRPKSPFLVFDGVICITRLCVFSRMMMTTLVYLHIRVSSSSLLPSFLPHNTIFYFDSNPKSVHH